MQKAGGVHMIQEAEVVPAKQGKGNRSVVRTTIVLPHAIDRHVEVHCAQIGLSKNDYVIRLIRADLEQQGYKPDQEFKRVEVEY